MVLSNSLQVAQATLPLRGCVDACAVELMQELVGVPFSELIVELALELGVQQRRVLLAFGPLAARTELPNRREQERSGGIELSRVLVVTQVHLEVQLALVRVAEAVGPLANEVLEQGTVTSVVEVEHGRCQDGRTRAPPLQHLIEQRGFSVSGVNASGRSRALSSLAALTGAVIDANVGVAGQAGYFHSTAHYALLVLAILDRLCKLGVPLVDVVLVEARWVSDC